MSKIFMSHRRLGRNDQSGPFCADFDDRVYDTLDQR